MVLGGGNVAFDCARVARRLGADEVLVACLESEETMPASADEIQQGLEEGLQIYPSRTFIRIVREDGKVKGVELKKVSAFYYDEDKRLQVETVDDSAHVIEADLVIFAIGQRPNIPDGFGIDKTESGLIDADPKTMRTSRDGVFAAADAVTGTDSVIKAIAAGRRAAVVIDKYLGGRGKIDNRLAPMIEPEGCIGRVEGFAGLRRCEEKRVPPGERISSFCRVNESMTADEAELESRRCLQCDLRLKITQVKFWGSY